MHILSIILPVFGVIGLGWLMRRQRVVPASAADAFNKFVYVVALPFLVLEGVLGLTPDALLDWKLIATNSLALFALTCASALLGRYLLRLTPRATAMFVIASYFGNVAYVGIPLNRLAYGEHGAALATFISLIVVLFAVIIGLNVLQLVAEKRGFRPRHALGHLARLPILWATVIGLLVVFLKIPVDQSILSFIGLVASIAGPLALFSLGMFMHEQKSVGRRPDILALALFNLLALPSVVFLIGKLIGLEGLPLKVSIIQAGMPVAVTSFVFAHQFKAEEREVGQAIVLSVLLSPFTLSLLLWLVESL